MNMPDPLTRQLTELRELLAKATPSPWLSNDHYECIQTHNDKVRLQPVVHYSTNNPNVSNDAALIVTAVNALPALLEALAQYDADQQAPATTDSIQAVVDSLGGAVYHMKDANHPPAPWEADSADLLSMLADKTLECEQLNAKLSALYRRTSRHSLAKNLGQAVEGDAVTMARVIEERDALRAERDVAVAKAKELEWILEVLRK